MYFITCFSNYECEYLDNYRTFGYFGNYATCRKALNRNWCDMCEAGYYTREGLATAGIERKKK